MDKEKQEFMNAGDSSYDSDAEDLLKDLEDDDDDDYDFGTPQPQAQQRRSLVNILSSSSNLEAISLSSASDFSPAGSGELAAEPMTLSPIDRDEEPMRPDVDDAGVSPMITQPIVPIIKDEPKKIDAKKDDAKDAIMPPPSKLHQSIKPFEFKPVDKIEPPKETPADKKVDKPLDTERITVDESATASNSSGRRPPVPPKMPSATIPTVQAVTPKAKEGELVFTQEALNDILPGGRLDDGRDLAFKFNDNNWYAQIFNEDFLRTVPASSPRQTQREAKFIIDRLGIESGARVLDLCCGFGRHTLVLAQKGFDMVGLDLSMVMLKKALADAQAKNQAIKFIHGDMRKLTFKAIFDAIYNVQTSFGYFDDVSNFKVLQGVFNALKPGGVFLIETVNPDFLIDELPLRLWWKGRECMLLEEIDMEALSGVLKITRSFVFDDQKRAPWEQRIQIRLYTAHEMRALLSRAGFKVIELSGDYSLPGAYFGATSPKNIFVAEKPVR
ncbi:MAG: class I SAM-dependent methyltransferase [Proteobacteria bacterium]|nr:class I SAM-dependent methyltransferase [Pseudomonadota bacterium]